MLCGILRLILTRRAETSGRLWFRGGRDRAIKELAQRDFFLIAVRCQHQWRLSKFSCQSGKVYLNSACPFPFLFCCVALHFQGPISPVYKYNNLLVEISITLKSYRHESTDGHDNSTPGSDYASHKHVDTSTYGHIGTSDRHGDTSSRYLGTSNVQDDETDGHESSSFGF